MMIMDSTLIFMLPIMITNMWKKIIYEITKMIHKLWNNKKKSWTHELVINTFVNIYKMFLSIQKNDREWKKQTKRRCNCLKSAFFVSQSLLHFCNILNLVYVYIGYGWGTVSISWTILINFIFSFEVLILISIIESWF